MGPLGATGGVGHVGIQLAKWRGAKVATTASSQRKLDIGADLGADTLINYKTEPVEDYVEQCTDGRGFDVVFDTVAGENVQTSVEATRLNGQVATVGAPADGGLCPAYGSGTSVHFASMLIPMLHDVDRAHHSEILRWTAELVEKGTSRLRKWSSRVPRQRSIFSDASCPHSAIFWPYSVCSGTRRAPHRPSCQNRTGR